MSLMRQSGKLTTVAALAAFGVSGFGVVATAQSTATVSSTPTSAASTAAMPANVTVDFGVSRGTLLRTERYNNLTRAHRYLGQRDADIQFYNEQGLHGKIYRVWIIVEDIYDPGTGHYNYEGIDDYLADVSRLSDELLV